MNRESAWLVGVFIAIIALVAIPRSAARAADEAQEADVEQMIANAKTAADHQAIADYFDKEAKHDHKLAVKYKKMAASYKNLPRMNEMEGHCLSLADFYKNAAQEAALLASRHQAMAQELKGQ